MALYEIYVDGAARGQGSDGSKVGHGACAMMLYKNSKLIGQYARGLGLSSSQAAEYEAVILGLLIAWSSELPDPVIYSDSIVVVNQVNRVWECKSEDLLPLLLSIWEIQDVYRFRLVHVKRHIVAGVDTLANQLLDKMLEPHHQGPST